MNGKNKLLFCKGFVDILIQIFYNIIKLLIT